MIWKREKSLASAGIWHHYIPFKAIPKSRDIFWSWKINVLWRFVTVWGVYECLSTESVASSEIETVLVTYNWNTSFVIILNNMMLAYVGSMGVAADRTWWAFAVVRQAQNSCILKRQARIWPYWMGEATSLPTHGANMIHNLAVEDSKLHVRIVASSTTDIQEGS
jgi:hypothetical protein